jgi:ATP-binding cassette, subfamily B, bacterial
MARKAQDLSEIAWSATRLGEMVENLARRSGLISHPARLAQPPEALLQASSQVISQWIDNAAASIGLESEPVNVLYAEVDQFLLFSWPAIIRLPGAIDQGEPRFIGLLSSAGSRATILGADLRTHRMPVAELRALLCATYEAPMGGLIDQVLLDAEVPEERREKARAAILRDQLGALRIEAGWMLRLPPGASLGRQFGQARTYRPVAILLGMYFIQQLLAILTWFVIGRGIFQGVFDLGWLMAWAILLLAIIPIQVIVNDAQTELSMDSGAIFKQRLLGGTLKLDIEEIRHQGMGQFLGRVMESEAVEMLAVSGGFMALLSFVMLFFAFSILMRGAGGAAQAWTLVIWVGLVLVVLWRYYLTNREWTVAYREMTNDLVENMVGHRTRLVQQDHNHWHDEEDETLDRYLRLSESMDQVGMQINAIISRGWTLVGLTGTAIAFVTLAPSPQLLAVSLGGVLFAAQGLAQLANGSQSLISLLTAWQQVGPLFKAASRPREVTALGFVPAQDLSQAGQDMRQLAQNEAQQQPVLVARDLVFRYRQHGKPVLQDCSLQIFRGDHVLLEGPSGGGKSTLAAVLTGLRLPESGSLLLWGFDRQILGPEEWRRRVVMAPQFQENYVFSDTFAFNLLMGRRWPPQQEDLVEAEEICRDLGLGEVLDRMPSGFQQILGESGWQLSHGERSRLFIARTLLQKADLVILDESFGALDPENLYRSLQCVLNRARTLLVIAHP